MSEETPPWLAPRMERLASTAASRSKWSDPRPLAMPRGCDLPEEIDHERLSRLGVAVPGKLPGSMACDPCLDHASVWDTVLSMPCFDGPPKVCSRKSLPPFRQSNTDWEGIASSLNRVGRPSGEGEFLRPSGRWIDDLMSMENGWWILESAHALSHARRIAEASKGAKGQKAGFLEELAELLVAMRYGLTVWCPTKYDMLHGRTSGMWLSDVGRLGIRIAVATNIRKPWVSMGVGEYGVRPYRDAIVVLVGIHLEPQPWSARTGNPDDSDRSWLEMNRWSCMPSISVISGWIGVDELCSFTPCSRNESSPVASARFCAPSSALDGPSLLDAYMASLPRYPQNHESGVWGARELLDSEWMKRLVDSTPALPCRGCLSLNMLAEGAPERPSCPRPEPGKKAGKNAEEEWARYDDAIDRIVETTAKACEFHYLRFMYPESGRKKIKSRNSRASRLEKCASRLSALRSKAASLRLSGFADRAAVKLRSAEAAMSEMSSALGG